MPRNFRIIASVLFIIGISFIATAQKDEYKDVLLDGKPAKLNVKTGKVTLVTQTTKSINTEKPVKQKAISESVVKTEETSEVINRVPESSDANSHIVKKGETLYSISKLHNISVDAIKRANGLNDNIIMVDQELIISNSSGTTSGSSNSWTVSRGDTLYSIAKNNGLTVDQLKDLNGLNSNLIRIGQTLKLK